MTTAISTQRRRLDADARHRAAAAGDAAWADAGDAAWDAANQKLEPTRISLQKSAVDLIQRMLEVRA